MIPPGPPARILALAEPVDSHWVASLNGTRLHAVRRVGWAQGWVLPSSGGNLTIRHVDHLRGIGLFSQGALLVVMVVLALPGATRRADEDDDPGPTIPPMRRHAHGDDVPGPDAGVSVGSAARGEGLR